MVDFRRVILAFALLALFTGLASADVISGGSQLTCSTNVTATPALRGEGFTEQTGDITISCTGGPAPVASTTGEGGALTQISPVNFTIFYNSIVTSRLFSTTTGVSEALLLIDEPGSGLGGDGPMTPQKLCLTPTTVCPAYVSTAAAAAATTSGAPYATTDGVTAAPNVYQGIVSANSVTFLGIPVLAPTTTGARVFRITNVRINAIPLAGGSSSGGIAVIASISTTPPSALSISNSSPNVGYVSASLTVGLGTAVTLKQCESVTKLVVNTLTFTEKFASAFKTRLNPRLNNLYDAQTGLVTYADGSLNRTSQSSPGGLYNSESNFVFPIGSGYAGLTGFGTRLKATFNNVPASARVFVSTANTATPPAVIGGTSILSYAQLVSSETVLDGMAAGTLPSLDTTGSGGLTEIIMNNGSGSAVWEVLNTNPNSSETFSFAVNITNAANTSLNLGASTVNLSYAPTATSGAATNSDVYPRFTGAPAATAFVSLVPCRTVLLYPYLTNQAGFDTGVTVANTTMDPFTTVAQSGTCQFNWYGGTTAAPTVPPAAFTTATIGPGTVYAQTLGGGVLNASTFQGYMIAVCNFQYAHGFAFISDIGARNIAMGYLAVVLNDPRANTNTTTNENGGN